MEPIPNCFYRVSAKALILNNENKFLLVKEDNKLWELPWWWLDFLENPQEWIKRELLEEMWLNANHISTKPSYFITSRNLKDTFWISNIIYEVQIDIKDILKFTPSEECQEVKFFSKEDAEKENLYPNVKEFIKQFSPENHKS